MLSKLASRRIAISLTIAVFIAGIVLIQSGGVSHAGREPALPLPTITATKAVTFTAGPTGDVDGDGKADPGDTITYTVTVNNTAAPGAGNDATAVSITDTLQNITTLTAGSVQVSPIVGADAYNVTGNVRIQPNAAAGLKANDIDPVTGNSASLTVTAGTVTSTQCVVATCPASNVTINADGSFAYNPPPGFEGTDTFTYTVTNAGGGTATGTATMTVSGMIWFVNNTAAACTTLAAGCGRLTNPFSSLANFQTLNNGGAGGLNPAANDNIFVFESATAYSGGVTLLSGQKLIGQDSTSTLISITGLTLAPNSDALPLMNTGAPATTILNAGGNAVTLNSGNTLNGFTTGNSSGPGISGVNFGTVTMGQVITNSTGQSIGLQNGTVAGTGFTSVTSTGGANGVVLNQVAGTLAISGGNITGTTGSSFAILGTGGASTCSVTDLGSITQSTNAPMVSITNHNTGTVTFNTGTLSATNGSGVQFDNADGIYNFSGTTTLTNGARIDILNGSSGTFGFVAATSVTNGGGTASFNVSASNPTVTYSGSISTNTLRPVSVSNAAAAACGTITFQTGSITATSGANGILVNNCNSGTINFNGPTVSLTTTTNNGVTLTTNTGATINFTPAGGGNGLDISTTSGAGFTATGGGTVNVAGAGNTISSTTGSALNVVNTTIGASGLTFQSISAGAAAGSAGNGITLDTTGNTAGLTVTGTGSAASGGTIQHKTGADGSVTSGIGIYLNSTKSPSFDRMQLNDFQNFAIRGTGVTGFSFTNSVVNSTGGGWNGTNSTGGVEESSISFDGLTGSATISNSSVSGGFTDNIRVVNTSGTLNRLTMDTLTLGAVSNGAALDGSQDLGDDSVHLEAQSTATMNVTFQNSTETSGRGDLFNLVNNGTGSVDLIFNNNHLSNNYIRIATGGGGVSMGTNGTGNFTYSMTNSTFRDAHGQGLLITHASAGNASITGTISGNIFGVNGVANSGSLEGDAIKLQLVGAVGAAGGTFKATLSGNTIQQYNNFGIDLLCGGGAPGIHQGTFEAIMTGNTIGPLGTNLAAAQAQGIALNGGTNVGDIFNIFVEVGGTGADANTVNNWTATNGLDNIRIRQRQSTSVHLTAKNGGGLDQYAGGPTDTAAVVAFIDAHNTPTGHNSATASGSGGGFVGGAPPFAPPSNEVPIDVTGNSGNDLSFLNMSYRSSSDLISTIQPLLNTSTHAQEVTPAEIASVSTETAATNGAQATAEQNGASYLDAASNVLAAVGEFAGKVGDAISPTVYAQKETPPKDSTPNATQSGETVTVNGGGPGFTLPAGKSMTITFKAKVDNGPYAAGINNITNSANVTAAGGINVNTNTTSFVLDAAPDLSITASDGATTTQPGGVITYVLTYKNGNAINGQDATGVTISNTVPPNTTFNLASSGTGWSCADGAIAGTVCTNLVGTVTANNTTATKNFAVKVLDALPAGVIQISNTATIAEVPANTNGTDLTPADNTGSDATNIIGNWLGGTSTDWNTAANWSNGVIPLSGNNVSVPTSGNQPTLISADVTVGNLTLGGQSVTINLGRILNTTGVVTLGANSVNGAGTLSLGAASTITRTTGQVNSILNKAFAGTGAFTYPVGTAGAFSPVDVNVTAGTGSLSVKANTGTAPSTPALTAANTLQRFWDLNGSGITADVTWHYLQTDVAGTEANYKVVRVIPGPGTPVTVPNGAPCPGTGSPCVDTTANTMFVRGLQNFSLWTATALAPTAAKVSLSGRVIRPDGLMAVRSLVSITDDHGNVRYAKTNPFGYFRFTDVESGQGYLINVIDKQFEFAPQFVSVTDNMGDLVLTLQPRP